MWIAAKRAGHDIGRDQVARLMTVLDIEGVTRRRKRVWTTRSDGALRSPDLVERNFTATAPNCLWVADITYIPTWAGFLYLAVVLDTFSRRIVGWAMATHLRTELVLEALNMALGQRRPAAVIHHSDQGSQGEFKRPSQQLSRESCDGRATNRVFRAGCPGPCGARGGGRRCGVRHRAGSPGDARPRRCRGEGRPAGGNREVQSQRTGISRPRSPPTTPVRMAKGPPRGKRSRPSLRRRKPTSSTT